jgi:hypothetical protein
LYCTGHDAEELYCVSLPKSGTVLRLVDVIPTTFPGQAFTWDRTEPGVLYSVDRAANQIVVSRLIDRPGHSCPGSEENGLSGDWRERVGMDGVSDGRRRAGQVFRFGVDLAGSEARPNRR